MNCANCSSEAMYEYKISESKSVFYCSTHLPRFLEPLRKAGNLTITPTFVAENEAAIAELSPSKPKKKAKDAAPQPAE